MSVGAREAAIKALGSFRRNNAWSSSALAAVIEKCGLDPRDAALAGHIFSGVLQNMALCDFYAAHFSSIDLKKLQPVVLDILRISIYQLVFLTKVPHSAAVNEGVALAKKHANPRAAGYVNAVLRKAAAAAAGAKLPSPAGKTAAERLSVEYSHPQWLVREIIDILGEEGARALLAADNFADTPITAQVNTLVTNADELAAALRGDGADAVSHGFLPGALDLRGTGNLERLDAFSKGMFFVQDAGARLSVIAAGVRPGDFVIDACAAPGGKSFAAALDMKNEGRILACDIHENKLRHIISGSKRLGINIIEARRQDASQPSDELSGAADVVIADVPCSGFGVIRKKPEIRYKPEGDAARLPEIQGRILANLSSYVKPGGTLLYSTCTIFRRENEEVVERFLENCGEFYPEEFTLPGAGPAENGMITLWPHINGTDGFFICRLRRRA